MAGRQTYEEIEQLMNDIDTLTKEQIFNRLSQLLIDPCPKCLLRCDFIEIRGRDLNPDCIGGAAGSYTYEVCSNCKHVCVKLVYVNIILYIIKYNLLYFILENFEIDIIWYSYVLW